ncbi:MAG TPA: DUF1707 domain-containing protein [Streptosporangiaceae bacterium]|jgi:hypothetical protein|nr:DUF1707 domain-containing protein [Streptosporangiaceae bacterium]
MASNVQMLASAADRDRAISVLKASFLDGRLTKDQFELRVGQALTARLFTEVMALTCDLPVGQFGRLPAHPATPAPPRTSRLAIAALVCAAAAPCTAGISAFPAIVLGYLARRRVRQTGERGAAVAAVALVLGWLAVLIGAVALLARHAV